MLQLESLRAVSMPGDWNKAMITEMHVPSPGESINEVEIVEWLKADGSYVLKDDALCEVESEKVTLTMHAEVSGKLKILVPEKSTVAVGSVACTIDADAKPEAGAGAPVDEQPKPAPEMIPEPPVEGKTAEQPDAKTPGEKPPERQIVSVPQRPVSRPASAAAERFWTDERPVRREKMSQLRQKVSQRLVAVKNQTAMLTTFNEVDMSGILDVRARYRDQFEEQYGVRLGFMSFFTRAVCEAMHDFPAVNSIIDGEEIVFPQYVDVGIAVSAKKGLMVPVVRNAHTMTFAEIEKEIADLAGKAREGKLTMDDLAGGTFTITNGGVFGSLLSTPILNPPQSAILGMHTIQERPVARDGQVVIKPMMYVALSYDHRVIDGRESVGYLKKVKETLEDPVRLLLGLSST